MVHNRLKLLQHWSIVHILFSLNLGKNQKEVFYTVDLGHKVDAPDVQWSIFQKIRPWLHHGRGCSSDEDGDGPWVFKGPASRKKQFSDLEIVV